MFMLPSNKFVRVSVLQQQIVLEQLQLLQFITAKQLLMEIYHQAIKRFAMSGGGSSGRMNGNN
jgi:hypothetical protein